MKFKEKLLLAKKINPIFILAFLCFLSVILLFFTATIFMEMVDEKGKNFKISGIVIPQKDKINFDVVRLKGNELTKKQQDEFIKLLIKEYIINRYSVNGSKYQMEKNLGIYNSLDNLNTPNGVLLKLPSLPIGAKQFFWHPSYNNFKTGENGELKEIKDLMEKGITRTAQILTEPVKNGDWWSVKVKFIYRDKGVYNRKNAKIETYQIDLFLLPFGLRGRVPFITKPSTIFVFQIEHIKKAILK